MLHVAPSFIGRTHFWRPCFWCFHRHRVQASSKPPHSHSRFVLNCTLSHTRDADTASTATVANQTPQQFYRHTEPSRTQSALNNVADRNDTSTVSSSPLHLVILRDLLGSWLARTIPGILPHASLGDASLDTLLEGLFLGQECLWADWSKHSGTLSEAVVGESRKQEGNVETSVAPVELRVHCLPQVEGCRPQPRRQCSHWSSAF